MLQVYRSFSEETLAMPVVWGRKSESEKFAGALRTYAIEALMGDGKALQAGTSHNLGQHFATAYGIEFLDKDQQRALPWSTSWGTSTRNIGGLVMTHGDDSGLILPPRLAPYQIVIVPIYRGDDERARLLAEADRLASELSDYRVTIDRREGLSPGYKFNDWEMRGVPLRIELGPRDLEQDQVTFARRDVPGRDGKQSVARSGVVAASAEASAVRSNLLILISRPSSAARPFPAASWMLNATGFCPPG